MPKKGMARPEWTHTQPRNDAPPVPEIQGKAKSGKKKARPIISGTKSPSLKVYHDKPHKEYRPASAYSSIFDNELAADNLENDIPVADLQDL